jgi:hypothetical protein
MGDRIVDPLDDPGGPRFPGRSAAESANLDNLDAGRDPGQALVRRDRPWCSTI